VISERNGGRRKLTLAALRQQEDLVKSKLGLGVENALTITSLMYIYIYIYKENSDFKNNLKKIMPKEIFKLKNNNLITLVIM